MTATYEVNVQLRLRDALKGLIDKGFSIDNLKFTQAFNNFTSQTCDLLR